MTQGTAPIGVRAGQRQGASRQVRYLLVMMWLLALACVLSASRVAAQSWAEPQFLPPEQAFPWQASIEGDDTLLVTFEIAPGYYLYHESLSLTADGVALPPAELPRGEVIYDPTFEKDMETHRKTVTLRQSLPLPAQPLTLTVNSQGCADAGLCYPPQQQSLSLDVAGSGYAVAAAATGGFSLAATPGTAASGGWLQANDEGLAAHLASGSLWQTLLVFFALGALLSFTPCVLPMVPILSALIVGEARAAGQVRPRRLRGLALSAVYVLGMSLVYTAAGVAAGLTGASLAATLQNPWVLSVFAAMLALLAMGMFGVITVQLPSHWQTTLSAQANRLPGGRLTGAFGMGAISALIVGPCVAAPLAGALLYISQTGDWVLGGAALFALAWGMGLLLLVAGVSAGALLPRAGAWMEHVKGLFGVLLLGVAWWLLMPVVPSLVQVLGWAVLAVLAGAQLGAFDTLDVGASSARRLAKGLAWIVVAWGAVLLVGAASGGRDALQPLAHWAQARGTAVAAPLAVTGGDFTLVDSPAELDAALQAAAGRPVMLDFYADWCISCKEMERFTFSDPDVAARMGQMVLLKADVTANRPEHQALLQRFRLFGPPGIILFDATGQERRDARVVGFQPAARFAQALDRVL